MRALYVQENIKKRAEKRRDGLYLYVQEPYSTGMKTTRLQGIGIVDAKPAAELKVGDITVWNFGYMHEVLAVEELSPKFVRLVTKSVTPDKGQGVASPHRENLSRWSGEQEQMKTKKGNTSPFFKELSDEALIENYIAHKALAHTGAAVKSRGLGSILRNLDIIIAIGRKRGLTFPV